MLFAVTSIRVYLKLITITMVTWMAGQSHFLLFLVKFYPYQFSFLQIYYHNILKTKANETQRAKKVVSHSPGLVDFAIRPVNSVFNLPNRQVMFFEEFE